MEAIWDLVSNTEGMCEYTPKRRHLYVTEQEAGCRAISASEGHS